MERRKTYIKPDQGNKLVQFDGQYDIYLLKIKFRNLSNPALRHLRAELTAKL